MGLAEKRGIAAYQADTWPAWKKKLDAVCGTDLPYEIAWPELAKDGYAADYPTMFEGNFFAPLEKALTSICRDALGKDSFKETIKKVRITSDRSWSSLEAKVADGVLHLDADPSYERTLASVDDYAERITKALEAAL